MAAFSIFPRPDARRNRAISSRHPIRTADSDSVNLGSNPGPSGARTVSRQPREVLNRSISFGLISIAPVSSAIANAHCPISASTSSIKLISRCSRARRANMRKPDRPKSGVIFRCAIYTRRQTMGSSRSSTLSTRSAKHARPPSRASVTPDGSRALDQACITRASRTRAILGPADPDWRGPNLGVAQSNRHRIERNARRASQANRFCRTFRPVDHHKPSPGWNGCAAGEPMRRAERISFIVA